MNFDFGWRWTNFLPSFDTTGNLVGSNWWFSKAPFYLFHLYGHTVSCSLVRNVVLDACQHQHYRHRLATTTTNVKYTEAYKIMFDAGNGQVIMSEKPFPPNALFGSLSLLALPFGVSVWVCMWFGHRRYSFLHRRIWLTQLQFGVQFWLSWHRMREEKEEEEEEEEGSANSNRVSRSIHLVDKIHRHIMGHKCKAKIQTHTSTYRSYMHVCVPRIICTETVCFRS